MISVSNVTVAYGSYVLLDGINFHISEQDKIGLVGKNGAGKSTLMKLITGEQSPTKGSVEKPSGVYTLQVREMIAAALSASFRVYRTAGNHNSQIGVPITMVSNGPKRENLIHRESALK